MRKKIIIVASVAIGIAGLIGAVVWFFSTKKSAQQSIRVGILHSMTGTLAISEKPVVEATLMALEEINHKGGVLGRKIIPILIDGKSDAAVFVQGAEHLITQEKVSVVFGCWTSASRKSVKPIFEKYNHLLFYPVQYEGLEDSPNIIYTGAAPNQQILPAVTWCFNNLGKTFYLVGSDYVFPRAANEIIQEHLKALGGTVVGQGYIPLGSKEVRAIVQDIVRLKPQVVLNTINGDSNIPFFQELRKAGITPEKIPVMSFSIAEQELKNLEVEKMVGDYAAWNYFQSIQSKNNEQFVENFKKKYGDKSVVSDPMEAAYYGVYLWAHAVEQAGATAAEKVREHVKDQSYNAPEGVVSIDGDNQHTWKFVRIGKIGLDGQFAVIWDSNRTIRPIPFPIYRTKTEWNAFLNTLYQQWGNRWAKEVR